LITRWPPLEYGHAPVYMPFSQSWLASEVSKDIGVLPLSYPYFHAQLFVEDARANLTAQIIEIADDCVVLTAVDRSSFSACGELFTVPTNEFLGRFTRLPPSEKPARR
jgi:hypothetical protein